MVIKCKRARNWRRAVAVAVFLSAAAGASPVRAREERAAVPDSTDAGTSGFLALPVLFYTPETKLAAGASVLRYFRPESAAPEARPSKIWATVIVTQRRQYVADLYDELYFGEGRYMTMGALNYQKFPDKFWGVGPDTPDSAEEDYTPKTLAFFFSVQNRVAWDLHVGLRYDLANSRVTQTEPGGILDRRVVPGSQGGVLSGLGAFVTWDTRDNIFYPSKGSFHTVSASLYGSALGSDYDYGKYVVDLRHYLPLGSRIVLAVQGLLDASSGVVPFQRMAVLGGQNILRGYYQGRYRDLYGLAGQVELRAHFFWRVGAAAFAGAGNVANRLGRFNRKFTRYSRGFGLRYTFDKDEHLNLRLDVGFGDGSTGMYITALEAF